MSRKNNRQKIAIIGPYPPPYGGISVHIERVLSYLDKTNYSYDFYLENKARNGRLACYEFYGFKKLVSLFMLLFKEYTLIHHHSPDWKTRVILSIYGMLGKNVYLHIHGVSLKIIIKGEGINSFLMRSFLKFVNVMADNEDIVDLAREYKAKSVVLIDAFLPPLYNENTYRQFIAKYGKLLEDKKYVISMVGSFTCYEGKDLYGFDLALQALQKLKKEINKDVVLLASINGVNSEKLHQKIRDYVVKNSLSSNTFFIYENLPEIWPIYIVSNVFIRPTCTDGSSLSVKEANWFETSVIASDAVPRPEGVILFKNRSANDLFKKLMEVYDSNDKLKDSKYRIRKTKNKKFKYKLFDEIYKLNYGGKE